MTLERDNRFNIIQPGISISSKYSTTGTLGMIVFDKQNNYKPCILSNWHILAKSSFLGTSFKVGKPIYQPGRAFQGKSRKNIIGRLIRYHKKTDSAIAEILNRPFELAQFESNKIITSIRKPAVGDIVEKSGVRTGVTRGKIYEIRGSKVKIKPLKYGDEISENGDSGSIWYDPNTLEGLVLHNAGETKNNPEAEFASGYIITEIFHKLNISISRPSSV